MTNMFVGLPMNSSLMLLKEMPTVKLLTAVLALVSKTNPDTLQMFNEGC